MPRRAALAALLAVTLAGCDYIAQKKLVVGQHTEQDVRQLMGVPDLVWDRPGGGKEWDYVRGSVGVETLRVAFGPDGRYAGMTQLLTEANFRNARPGMTGEELTRLFSKPTEVQRFPRKREVVWSWRYAGDGEFKYHFNAHIDEATGRTTGYSRTDDPRGPGA
jgi:hypothetical protein